MKRNTDRQESKRLGYEDVTRMIWKSAHLPKELRKEAAQRTKKCLNVLPTQVSKTAPMAIVIMDWRGKKEGQTQLVERERKREG